MNISESDNGSKTTDVNKEQEAGAPDITREFRDMTRGRLKLVTYKEDPSELLKK